MNKEEYLPPDLSHLSITEVCALMLQCGMSEDKSDRDFANACRDELARRKPEKKKKNKDAK